MVSKHSQRRGHHALVLPANSPTIHCCGQPIRHAGCHCALCPAAVSAIKSPLHQPPPYSGGAATSPETDAAPSQPASPPAHKRSSKPAASRVYAQSRTLPHTIRNIVAATRPSLPICCMGVPHVEGEGVLTPRSTDRPITKKRVGFLGCGPTDPRSRGRPLPAPTIYPITSYGLYQRCGGSA